MREVKAYQKREVLKMFGVIAIRVLMTVIAIIAVAAAFWAVWWYKTELDALYLLAWYIMFGSILNWTIIAFAGSNIKSYYNTSVKRIRLMSKIIKRRTA